MNEKLTYKRIEAGEVHVFLGPTLIASIQKYKGLWTIALESGCPFVFLALEVGRWYPYQHLATAQNYLEERLAAWQSHERYLKEREEGVIHLQTEEVLEHLRKGFREHYPSMTATMLAPSQITSVFAHLFHEMLTKLLGSVQTIVYHNPDGSTAVITSENLLRVHTTYWEDMLARKHIFCVTVREANSLAE